MLKRLSLLAAVCSIILVAGCNVLPPVTPPEPTGPSTGDVGVSYSFTAVTTDPQNLPLRYQFDWGDARECDEWSHYAPSGEPVTMDHTWLKSGAYHVRVRAQNVSGRESELSPAHVILIGSQSGYPDTVIATIQAPGDPSDIGVLPDGKYAYTANGLSQYVAVVDIENRQVVKHITCGTNPYMLGVRPGGEYVYVTSEWDNEVTVIRTSDNSVVKKIPVGACPHRLCFSPDGSRCYTANQNDSTVSVIRTSDNTVIATVAVGPTPRDVDCDGEYVYTANLYGTTLTKIRVSDNTVVGTIELGFTAHRVRVKPGGEYVYASEYHGSRIAVVRASDGTVVAVIQARDRVAGVCFLSGGAYMFVAGIGGSVLVVRTSDNTIIDSMPTGSGTIALGTPADEAFVATADLYDATVTIIGRR
jgi:YVTN family beta-propeller protein